MPKYNLYAGLGGGFGGSTYTDTAEFDNLEDATNAAYDLAKEEYESYEGMHGLRSWNECRDDYMEEYEIEDPSDLGEEDNSYIDDIYNEEVEGWICYHAVLASEDPDFEGEDEG